MAINRFMIKHPRTGKCDPFYTLVCVTVVVCLLKFLCEGVSITVADHIVSLGHVDSGTYGLILSTVLGAHGYLETKSDKKPEVIHVEQS